MTVDDGTDKSSGTANTLRLVGALFGLVFLIGVGSGYWNAASDHPLRAVDYGIMALIGGFGLWLLAMLVRTVRIMAGGLADMPRRERFSTRFTVGSLMIGALLGMGYAFVDEARPALLVDSDGQWTPLAAITAALLWGVGGTIGTLFWLRRVDEHERDAYLDGANWAAHALLFAMPVWWMLWRAALVPPPDVMLCLIAASLLWFAVWLRRKYG